MKACHWMRWAVLGGLVLACGCSKLTYENWQTIQVGSASPEVVKATIGEPWKTVDNTWVYNESDRPVVAIIKFKDNKVIGKEWSDAERGRETVGEHPDQPGQSEDLHIQQIK